MLINMSLAYNACKVPIFKIVMDQSGPGEDGQSFEVIQKIKASTDLFSATNHRMACLTDHVQSGSGASNLGFGAEHTCGLGLYIGPVLGRHNKAYTHWSRDSLLFSSRSPSRTPNW